MRRSWKLLLFAATAAVVMSLGSNAIVGWYNNTQADRGVSYVVWMATIEYANLHHGRLPDANHWEDSLRSVWSHGPHRFAFTAELTPGFSYIPRRLAMNSSLSGMGMRAIGIRQMARTVLYYEVDSRGSNATGNPPRDILDPPFGRLTPMTICLDGQISNPVP